MLYEYMGRVIAAIVKCNAPDGEKQKAIEKMTLRFKTNREKFFQQLLVSGKCAEAESLTKEALLMNMSVLMGFETHSYVDEFGMKTRSNTGLVFHGIAYSSLM